MMEVRSPYSYLLFHIKAQGVKRMTVWTEGKLGVSLRQRMRIRLNTEQRWRGLLCSQGVEQSTSAFLPFVVFWRTAVATIYSKSFTVPLLSRFSVDFPRKDPISPLKHNSTRIFLTPRISPKLGGEGIVHCSTHTTAPWIILNSLKRFQSQI